jgi:hypothetical protein
VLKSAGNRGFGSVIHLIAYLPRTASVIRRRSVIVVPFGYGGQTQIL